MVLQILLIRILIFIYHLCILQKHWLFFVIFCLLFLFKFFYVLRLLGIVMYYQRPSIINKYTSRIRLFIFISLNLVLALLIAVFFNHSPSLVYYIIFIFILPLHYINWIFFIIYLLITNMFDHCTCLINYHVVLTFIFYHCSCVIYLYSIIKIIINKYCIKLFGIGIMLNHSSTIILNLFGCPISFLLFSLYYSISFYSINRIRN